MATTSPTDDRVYEITDASSSKHERPTFSNLDPTIARSLNLTDPHRGTVQPFRFFDLPAEIRYMILGYTLVFECPLQPSSAFSGGSRPLIDVRLLATCHQMYKEALQIFYGRNTFQLSLYSVGYDGLPTWVAHPEQFTRHLRRFRIMLRETWTQWYPQHQEEVDEIVKTLALCQRLEVVEVVFLFSSQPLFRALFTITEVFPDASPASIKKLLDVLSSIPGKRLFYRRDFGSQRYKIGRRDQGARFRNNLALSAELINIDELSTE